MMKNKFSLKINVLFGFYAQFYPIIYFLVTPSRMASLREVISKSVRRCAPALAPQPEFWPQLPVVGFHPREGGHQNVYYKVKCTQHSNIIFVFRLNRFSRHFRDFLIFEKNIDVRRERGKIPFQPKYFFKKIILFYIILYVQKIRALYRVTCL